MRRGKSPAAIRALQSRNQHLSRSKLDVIENARPLGLVYRPRLVKRDDCYVLVIRSWPSSGRERSIALMRKAKLVIDQGGLELAASEICTVLRAVVGHAFGGVVLPPRGASKTELHFGSELALRVAQESGVPVAGKCHYVKELRQERFHGEKFASEIEWRSSCRFPVVVDDVYTTGQTLAGIRLAIGGPCLCAFRRNPATDSETIRPLIPI